MLCGRSARRWLLPLALSLAACAPHAPREPQPPQAPQPPAIVNLTPHVPDPGRGKPPPDSYYAANAPDAFDHCKSCHTSARRGPAGIGPNLWGVFGRRAGSKPGYAYSPQLREAGKRGLVWNRETLERWLTHPRGTVPGTKMVYGGMADPEKRKALVAYIARLR